MTKQELLRTMRLLSAIESLLLARKEINTIPDYILEELASISGALEREILKPNSDLSTALGIAGNKRVSELLAEPAVLYKALRTTIRLYDVDDDAWDKEAATDLQVERAITAARKELS